MNSRLELVWGVGPSLVPPVEEFGTAGTRTHTHARTPLSQVGCEKDLYVPEEEKKKILMWSDIIQNTHCILICTHTHTHKHTHTYWGHVGLGSLGNYEKEPFWWEVVWDGVERGNIKRGRRTAETVKRRFLKWRGSWAQTAHCTSLFIFLKQELKCWVSSRPSAKGGMCACAWACVLVRVSAC